MSEAKSEIVERVARAIASDPMEIEKGGRPLLRIDWENSAALYRVMARKAIAAMREPTNAMVDVGDMEQCDEFAGDQVAMSSAVPWRVMIDEALR